LRLIYLGGAWIAGVLAGSLFQPPPACLFIGLLPLPLLLRRRWQPDERDQTTRLRLSGLAIETEGGWPQVQGGYPTVRPQIPTI
jgi:hypothetical protein